MIRLFAGIELPDDVRHKLGGLACGLPGAKWVPVENLHVTLRFIGDIDEGKARDIDAALGGVRAAAFDLALKEIGFFGPARAPRVLWAGVERGAALNGLHAKVEKAVVEAGIAPEGRKFKPHITLARFRERPPSRLGDYISGNGMFHAGPFAVERFTLFSSQLKPGGALHRVESVYPLAPR